jgi:predicted aldo/keto reductase-like oxidoreductase
MATQDRRKRQEQGGAGDDGRELSRREFVVAGALAGAALGGGFGCAGAGQERGAARAEEVPPPGSDLGPIPRRVLGRTGEEVSILGLGTAPMGEGPPGVEECASVFSEAIDRGMTYVDTARIYGNAEEALARILPGRRAKVFLVTKCMTDTREAAQESFETSLRTLGVDAVDLLHLHSTGDRDIDQVLAPGGVWDYLLEMKKQGKTRFVGITGHNRPEKFLRLISTGQVDAMMVAMNFVDRHVYGFEEKVLPAARAQGTGVMGMKTFGGILGGFRYTSVRRPSQLDPIHLQNAVRYSLSLEGVTGIVIGVHDAAELRQNIRFVLNAAPLSDREREALESHGKRLAPEWGPRFGPVA